MRKTEKAGQWIFLGRIIGLAAIVLALGFESAKSDTVSCASCLESQTSICVLECQSGTIELCTAIGTSHDVVVSSGA